MNEVGDRWGFKHNENSNPQPPGVISDGESPSQRPWETHDYNLAGILKGYNKGVALQYVLHSNLHPWYKQVKSQAKNL